jgi:hypothetical protein
MRIAWTAILAALFVCALAGCAASSATQLAGLSESHLDDLSAHLDAAGQDLLAAQARLANQPDPHQAIQAVNGGYAEIQQAAAVDSQVQHDVSDLASKATALQKQIDEHKNDLLGPRAIRIRNRVICIAVLISIGAALLQWGPLLGGPWGGAAIVIGHLLTLFIMPIFRFAWRVILWVFDFVVGALNDLGQKAATANQLVASPAGAKSGASNAQTGSD